MDYTAQHGERLRKRKQPGNPMHPAVLPDRAGRTGSERRITDREQAPWLSVPWKLASDIDRFGPRRVWVARCLAPGSLLRPEVRGREGMAGWRSGIVTTADSVGRTFSSASYFQYPRAHRLSPLGCDVATHLCS